MKSGKETTASPTPEPTPAPTKPVTAAPGPVTAPAAAPAAPPAIIGVIWLPMLWANKGRATSSGLVMICLAESKKPSASWNFFMSSVCATFWLARSDSAIFCAAVSRSVNPLAAETAVRPWSHARVPERNWSEMTLPRDGSSGGFAAVVSSWPFEETNVLNWFRRFSSNNPPDQLP